MKTVVLTAAFALAATAAFAAVPAPKPSIATLADLPVVTMQPYNVNADAKAEIAAAFARAKKSGKTVMIDLGGNWCGDCIVLTNFMKLPEMKRFMDAHYEVVPVNVGRYDTNLDVQKRFGFADKLKGVPTLLIATPDGKLVNGKDVFAFTDARHMTPQALADYLAKWPAK